MHGPALVKVLVEAGGTLAMDCEASGWVRHRIQVVACWIGNEGVISFKRCGEVKKDPVSSNDDAHATESQLGSIRVRHKRLTEGRVDPVHMEDEVDHVVRA